MSWLESKEEIEQTVEESEYTKERERESGGERQQERERGVLRLKCGQVWLRRPSTELSVWEAEWSAVASSHEALSPHGFQADQ